MKLTFSVDGKVYYDAAGNYYARSFNGLYEKYSYLTDDITFLVRTEKTENALTDTMLPKQISIVSVPNFKSLTHYFSHKKKAEIIIKNQIKKSDWVILRIPGSISELSLKYVNKYKKAYCVECVGCPWDAYRNHSLLGKFIAPFEFIKTRNIIRHADFVTYVTNSFLQKRYPTKGISVSISDVELRLMNDEVLNSRLLRIKKPSDTLVLGTAGTVEIAYKGQQYVIEAISNLKKKGIKNIKYILVGGGNNKRLKQFALKMGVPGQVIFQGSIPHSEIFNWLDSIDLYIQPSIVEGMPRAVVEAMSRACPVIGSRVGGILELIDKRFLFKKGNSKAIEKTIMSIDENSLLEMAKMNFDKAKEFEKRILNKKRTEFYDLFLKNSLTLEKY